jgi:SAM-dependent methyltransferase
VEALVERLRRGDGLDALLECLAVPELPRPWSSLPVRRLTQSRIARCAARIAGKRKLLSRVMTRRDVLGARDVLEFYYLSGGPLDPAMGHYFIRRFGQPRHLAALSLAATIPSGSKPILDIACGIGHLEHYFGCRKDAAQVVGLDMNFYHLWIARHWMAPTGRYVCANASDGLPFSDGCFAATLCSDAYHYIGNRPGLLGDIDRCAPGRMVVLTRVGNASVTPNEGVESTLADYLGEFGDVAVRVFDEAELVKRYQRRVDALSRPAKARKDLEESKWLSFAWNIPAPPERTIESDSVPPHAVGRVGINPIYTRRARPDGAWLLRFEFPIVWYAYENHAMLSYHPRTATLSTEQMAAVAAGRSDPSLRPLIDSFVLLGLPPRFDRSGGPESGAPGVVVRGHARARGSSGRGAILE